MELNGVSDIVTTVKADAVKYMEKMQADGQLFDIVICDPPKLAPTRTSLEKAKNKYVTSLILHFLNLLLY
jgi:23S rRNA (cytosine1962-C5)-methyltransferase